jgi:hypothetical protein
MKKRIYNHSILVSFSLDHDDRKLDVPEMMRLLKEEIVRNPNALNFSVEETEDVTDEYEDDLGSVDFCPVCKEDYHGEVCLRTDKGEKL